VRVTSCRAGVVETMARQSTSGYPGSMDDRMQQNEVQHVPVGLLMQRWNTLGRGSRVRGRGYTCDTPVCHTAEFESDVLRHCQPVELVTHHLGHTNPRRKPHDATSRRTQQGLQTVEQAQRSVGQNTVTIVPAVGCGSSHRRVRILRHHK